MHEYYENPLCGRYAGEEMKRLFSDDVKFSTWRKLWIALAESEKELGLAITDGQIDQMKAHIYDIDYESAARHEHVHGRHQGIRSYRNNFHRRSKQRVRRRLAAGGS